MVGSGGAESFAGWSDCSEVIRTANFSIDHSKRLPLMYCAHRSPTNHLLRSDVAVGVGTSHNPTLSEQDAQNSNCVIQMQEVEAENLVRFIAFFVHVTSWCQVSRSLPSCL